MGQNGGGHYPSLAQRSGPLWHVDYATSMIDLHTHSTFSDGSDTPGELAAKAHALGLSALALTDHDTTASHDQMAAATASYGIELVPGVEVSLRDNEFPMQRGGETVPRNVHVLAYFLPLDA